MVYAIFPFAVETLFPQYKYIVVSVTENICTQRKIKIKSFIYQVLNSSVDMRALMFLHLG